MQNDWDVLEKIGPDLPLLFQMHKSWSVDSQQNYYKMLSYRRETALQGALQFSPKVEDWNWETIFYGHYRSIFNHCDIIGLKIRRIP